MSKYNFEFKQKVVEYYISTKFNKYKVDKTFENFTYSNMFIL